MNSIDDTGIPSSIIQTKVNRPSIYNESTAKLLNRPQKTLLHPNQRINPISNVNKKLREPELKNYHIQEPQLNNNQSKGVEYDKQTNDNKSIQNENVSYFNDMFKSVNTKMLMWLVETSQKLEHINNSSTIQSLQNVQFAFECLRSISSSLPDTSLEDNKAGSIDKKGVKLKRSSKTSPAVPYLKSILNHLTSLFENYVFDKESGMTATPNGDVMFQPYFESVKFIKRGEEIERHTKEQHELLEKLGESELDLRLEGIDPIESNPTTRYKYVKARLEEQEEQCKHYQQIAEESEKTIIKLKKENQKEIELRETAIRELEKKIARITENMTTLNRELNELREYKNQNDKFANMYISAREEYSKKLPVNMFSYNTQADTIIQLHEQMEMIENERIDRYSDEVSNNLFGNSDNTTQYFVNQFVNDVDIINDEMTKLSDKVDELTSTFVPENVHMLQKSILSNEQTNLLRYVDAKKQREYIEIHTSESDKKFKLILKQPVTPQYEPIEFELPMNTKWIKIVFAKYANDRIHPNPSLLVENSEHFADMFQSKIQRFVNFNISETMPLWKGYRSVYGSKGPALSRKMDVKQLREIIHFAYLEHWEIISQLSVKSIKHRQSFWNILFSVIKKKYILPEIVMKISFEVLSSIEDLSNEFIDIMEFRKSLEGRNDTSIGRCINTVMLIFRRLWLSHARDYNRHIDQKTLEYLMQLIYFDVQSDKLRKIIKNISEFDEDQRTNDTYPIQHFYNYYISNFYNATEYWCNFCANHLKKLGKDRLHIDDYLKVIEEIDPGIDRYRLTVRFIEACQQSVNPVVNQLHISVLSLLYAELKWMNNLQVTQSHQVKQEITEMVQNH